MKLRKYVPGVPTPPSDNVASQSNVTFWRAEPSQTRGTRPHGPHHLGLDFCARVQLHYLVHVDQPNCGPRSQTFIKLSFDRFWTRIGSTFSDVQQLLPRFQLPPSCLLSSLKSVLYGWGVQNFGGNLILCLVKPYGKRFDRTGEKCVCSLSCSWLCLRLRIRLGVVSSDSRKRKEGKTINRVLSESESIVWRLTQGPSRAGR